MSLGSESIWGILERGPFIIAEIGKNFIQTPDERPVSEYLANAKELARLAKESGAHAVKFQTHTVGDEQLNIEVTSPHFKGSDRYSWILRNTRATPREEFWVLLKEYCDELGIIFFSTPMSRGAAELLDTVGVPLWKIGSGDILDFVLLDYLRNSGKPIIISSGMSTLAEVERAINFLREKNPQVALLHCVSKYPCPAEELHLGTIDFYKEQFGMPIGFSDHSIGIEPSLVAVAMGATIIEKHFSLSRDLWGSDHKVSMTPDELRSLRDGIDAIVTDPNHRAQILQSDFAIRARTGKDKILQEDEAVFRPLFRKSLMAAHSISAGTIITSDMVYAMRPQAYALGIPSENYEQVIGRRTTRDFKQYDPIRFEDLAS